jgi:hypothetical protein
VTIQVGDDARANRIEPGTFRVFGLRLRCSPPIPGLVTLPTTSGVDVEVRLEAEGSWPKTSQKAPRQLWYTSANLDQRGEPVLEVWTLADDAFFHLRYGDGTEFLVDRSGTQVWGTWPAALTFEDACTYLLGPVLGLVLRFRGITCLHASAIDLGGQAIAIVGPPGSGKSTTAAIFAKSGYGVLSDDVVALADHGSAFLAQPAYPRLGLWAESIEALFGSPDVLPRQTPTWDKRYLALTQNGYKFQPSPLPLSAVYVLSGRDTDARAPFVDALPLRVGLTQLIENTYVSYLLDRTMSAQDFDVLARLVLSMPVRRLVSHADSGYLSSLRDVILDDFQALTATVPR